MMDMNSGLETEIVATGLIAMLGMAVWLFFRDEQNGEKSLFSKMLSPYDDGMTTRSSVPLLLPSVEEGFLKDYQKNHDHGFEVLNQRMNMIPIARPKEIPMKSQSASTNDLQDKKNSVQSEPVRQSLARHWQKSAGMFSGQQSLGGILVVDDDRANRKLTRLILEDVGYDILEAEDGQEAINLLSSGENPMVVDLIITDLNMPKVDGFDAIASFQKEYPSIPVIVLTGIADPEVETSFMRQGVSDYLLKPVDTRTLITSVANAIAQRQLLQV